MDRRIFIASIGLAPFAVHAAAQNRPRFVCPPCGCPNDGKAFETPGTCPSCGMGLVDAALLNEIEGIPNFRKVEQKVWTAGQPTMEHFATLKDQGVATVINLRPHGESNNLGELEESRVRDLGLTYINIPVVFGALRDAAVDDFLKATDAELQRGTVLIHCAAAVRVAAFWMIRRVMRDGWSLERALEEANRIGLGNNRPLIEFAREYIGKHSPK